MRDQTTVKIGSEAPTRTIGPVTQTDIVRFAGAGGDFNPLHHDPEFVSAAGFPKVVSMGQMQAGMLAAVVSDWLGVENVIELEVRFRAPLFVGDTITLGARVSDLDTTGADTVASIELTGTRGDAVIVEGTALAKVRTDG